MQDVSVVACEPLVVACDLLVVACDLLVVACDLLVATRGIYFSDQGRNLGPLHGKCGVLATWTTREVP